MNLTHSENISDLAKSLAAARKKFKAVKKEQTNPFFKSKYADLSAVIDATESALSDHGLSIVQSPITHETQAGVTTMLIHESGQWMRGDLLLPVAKGDAQGVGSAITYARRYSYQGIVNVAAETDDDANAASGKETQAKAATMPKPPVRSTPAQAKPSAQAVGNGGFLNIFWAKAKASGKNEQTIRNYIGSLGYEHTEEIPPTKYNEALEWAGATQ